MPSPTNSIKAGLAVGYAATATVDGSEKRLAMAGGLLGHWAVWTRCAVDTLARARTARVAGGPDHELLTLASEVTDCNAALFDAAHGFSGCIAGVKKPRPLRGRGLFRSQSSLVV